MEFEEKSEKIIKQKKIFSTPLNAFFFFLAKKSTMMHEVSLQLNDHNLQ